MNLSDERAQNFSVTALSSWSWLLFDRAQRGTRARGDAERITHARCGDRCAVRGGRLALSTEVIEGVAELELRAGDGSKRRVGARRTVAPRALGRTLVPSQLLTVSPLHPGLRSCSCAGAAFPRAVRARAR